MTRFIHYVTNEIPTYHYIRFYRLFYETMVIYRSKKQDRDNAA